MVGKQASTLKVVSISACRSRDLLTQAELAESERDRQLMEAATEKYEAGFNRIQQKLENGAAVEAGPLQATLKTRKFLILHSMKRTGSGKKV